MLSGQTAILVCWFGFGDLRFYRLEPYSTWTTHAVKDEATPSEMPHDALATLARSASRQVSARSVSSEPGAARKKEHRVESLVAILCVSLATQDSCSVVVIGCYGHDGEQRH